MLAEIVSSEGPDDASVESYPSTWEHRLENLIDQMTSTGNIVALRKLTQKLSKIRAAVKLKRDDIIAQSSLIWIDVPQETTNLHQVQDLSPFNNLKPLFVPSSCAQILDNVDTVDHDKIPQLFYALDETNVRFVSSPYSRR